MDKLKQWVLLTVVGCLAVVAAGWFLLVAPRHAEAEDLRVQTAAQEGTNQVLRTQLTVLKRQAKDLPRQQARLAAVAAKIPPNPALPALIRALDAASADSGVELVSIAPGTPAPVGAATAATTGTTGTPGSAGTAAAGTGGALTAVPLTVQVVGGYFEVQQFLRGVETTTRALRVTSVALVPGTNPVSRSKAPATQDGRVLSASITGEAYVAGDAPAAAPGAATTAASTPTTPTTPGTTASAPVAPSALETQ